MVGLYQSDEKSTLIRRKQAILICLDLCKHLNVSHVCGGGGGGGGANNIMNQLCNKSTFQGEGERVAELKIG